MNDAVAKPAYWSTLVLRAAVFLLALGVMAIPAHLLLRGQNLTAFLEFEGARDRLEGQAASRQVLRRKTPLPPTTCNLAVRQTPFARSCELLEDVCLDQVCVGWGRHDSATRLLRRWCVGDKCRTLRQPSTPVDKAAGAGVATHAVAHCAITAPRWCLCAGAHCAVRAAVPA